MMGPIQEVFYSVYGDAKETRERNLDKKISFYENYDKHPLFRKILELKDLHYNLDTDKSPCDDVFADYLIKISNFCNQEYFEKLLKFVVLFRECVNFNYKHKASNGGEYAQNYNAEDVPDISNEFITEFLEPFEPKENNTFNFSKEEAIELTQNFCSWLFDNNYTCSKLSLIN
jgi:hypothetical protein